MGLLTNVSRGVLVLSLTALASSCGDPQPELVVRAGFECAYDGPEEVSPGFSKMRLVEEGSGRNSVEVVLYRLDGTTYEDVVQHYESEDARFEPIGTHVAQRLALGARTRGEADSVQMVAGKYAVVCFYDDSPGAVIGDITVTDG